MVRNPVHKTVLTLVFLCSFTISSFANKSDATKKVDEQQQLVQKGQKIAQDRCAMCHAIGKIGQSTHKEAPLFRAFSKKWPLESLEESLAEGIMTGHKDMPEFVMKPDEITSFLAYLHSLNVEEKK